MHIFKGGYVETLKLCHCCPIRMVQKFDLLCTIKVKDYCDTYLCSLRTKNTNVCAVYIKSLHLYVYNGIILAENEFVQRKTYYAHNKS